MEAERAQWMIKDLVPGTRCPSARFSTPIPFSLETQELAP